MTVHSLYGVLEKFYESEESESLVLAVIYACAVINKTDFAYMPKQNKFWLHQKV